MAQELQLFGDKTVAVPAHIQQAFTETNITERDRLPTLTFKGKVFAITENNETTNLMKVDEEGDRVPIPSISVVVLEYAKARGRNYHEGSYDPDNTSAPKCWSTNSITPDDNVPEPENDKCATCPKAAKGSRTNDAGKPTVACSQHRLLAVVPIKRLDISPLRLKIPVTSDYDGQSPDLQAQGKFAFSNYLEFIKARGVLHTASMVTKVAFDPNQAYPKLLFSAQRWLTEPELAAVQEARKGGGVEAILGISGETTAKLPKPETAAAGGTTQAQVDAAAAQRAAQEKAAKEQAEKEAAEKAAKEKAEKAAAKKAAKEAAEREAAEKAAAAAAAASKPSSTGNGTVSASAGDFSDDDDEGGAPVTTAKADTAAPKKEVVEAKDSGIGDILNEWGADD